MGGSRAAAPDVDLRQALRQRADALLAVGRSLDSSGPGSSGSEFAEWLRSQRSIGELVGPEEFERLIEVAQQLESRDDLASALSVLDTALADGATPDPAALALLDRFVASHPADSKVAQLHGRAYLALAQSLLPTSAEARTAAARARASFERAIADPELRRESAVGAARAAELAGDETAALDHYRLALTTALTPETALAAGRLLARRQEWAEADRWLQEALKAAPQDPQILWADEEALAHLRAFDRAIERMKALAEIDPSNPLYLRREGELLLEAGRRAEAQAILRRSAQLAPQDPKLHLDLAEAYRAQGLYDDALTHAQEAVALAPKNRTARRLLAGVQLISGRPALALATADQGLHDDASDLDLWRIRADASRKLDRVDDLVYSLTAVVRLDPSDADARLELARLDAAAGRLDEAWKLVASLTEPDGPKHADGVVWLERGKIAERLGRISEAGEAYARAAELAPHLARLVAVQRARMLLGSGRPDLALTTLETAPPGDGQPSDEVAELKAEILTALERPADARAVLEPLYARQSESAPLAARLARTYLDEGRPAEARPILEAQIARTPTAAELFLLLAEAGSATGDPDAARQAIRRGLESVPTSVELWTRLGEIEFAAGAFPAARDAFARALAVGPKTAKLLLQTAAADEKLGRPEEALAFAEEASRLEPRDALAWVERGRLLLLNDRPQDARASFQQAASLAPDLESARSGLRLAEQKVREARVERYAVAALRLEARLGRLITKNDIFVTLHAPFETLDEVLRAIAEPPPLDLAALSETERAELEASSHRLIVDAMDRRVVGIERRGFTLADVALLTPETAPLRRIQREYAYLSAVLRSEIDPKSVRLTPELEDVARRALSLPLSERTVFGLVRRLGVGVATARTIKAIEASAALGVPTRHGLDLAALSPEFAGPELPPPTDSPPAPVTEPAIERSGPVGVSPAPSSGPREIPSSMSLVPPNIRVRCLGCGGMAAFMHQCGAGICRHCAHHYGTCPKCNQPLASSGRRATPIVSVRPVAASSASEPTPRRAHPKADHASTGRPLNPAANRSAGPPTAATRPKGEAAPSTRATSSVAPPVDRPRPVGPSRSSPSAKEDRPAPEPEASPTQTPVSRPVRRGTTDDEPRL